MIPNATSLRESNHLTLMRSSARFPTYFQTRLEHWPPMWCNSDGSLQAILPMVIQILTMTAWRRTKIIFRQRTLKNLRCQMLNSTTLLSSRTSALQVKRTMRILSECCLIWPLITQYKSRYQNKMTCIKKRLPASYLHKMNQSRSRSLIMPLRLMSLLLSTELATLVWHTSVETPWTTMSSI